MTWKQLQKGLYKISWLTFDACRKASWEFLSSLLSRSVFRLLRMRVTVKACEHESVQHKWLAGILRPAEDRLDPIWKHSWHFLQVWMEGWTLHATVCQSGPSLLQCLLSHIWDQCNYPPVHPGLFWVEHWCLRRVLTLGSFPFGLFTLLYISYTVYKHILNSLLPHCQFFCVRLTFPER